jgi:RNA polymerase sigma factor (sigma-70 family)
VTALGGTLMEQKALRDRLLPMVREIAKKRARLGRVLPFHELFDIAQSALNDALMSHEGDKSAVAGYVHTIVDQTLLNAIVKAKRRAMSRIFLALRAMYVRARELRERGQGRYDSDEEVLQQLCDISDDLADTAGVRLTMSPEETYTESDEACAVRATLGQLSPYEARILWMRFAEERTLEQIAEEEKTSVATVYRDLEAAMKRLKALLRRTVVRCT